MRSTTLPLLLAVLVVVSLASRPAAAEDRPAKGVGALWAEPVDISSRNLFYGPGGKQSEPQGSMRFVEEDSQGTTPKFEVLESDQIKWKVKLGVEARPETVATRLLWAAGYFTDEDYFVSSLQIEGMPSHLRRGQNLIGPGGKVENARLERHIKGQENVGHWHWKRNPFTGTREFNGLRVMMALMNNWDLKDVNTAIYEESSNPAQHLYVVSDLGAAFGTTGNSWTHAKSKGNLKAYRHSRFITKVTPDYVDFNVPTRPALLYLFTPKDFVSRVRMRWIGKHVPRADAKWIGGWLARLSPEQIQDAFRAAGYTPAEVEAFAKTVEERIAQLNQL